MNVNPLAKEDNNCFLFGLPCNDQEEDNDDDDDDETLNREFDSIEMF